MPNDDLGERITGQTERLVFGDCFLLGFQRIGGLDIGLFAAASGNKVNLTGNMRKLTELVLFAAVDDTYIYFTAANAQLVVDNVLHDVRHFLPAEADSCIAKPQIIAVILVGIIKIVLALHIKAAAFLEQVCVGKMPDVCLYGVGGYRIFSRKLLL